jgi:hypothetical protein
MEQKMLDWFVNEHFQIYFFSCVVITLRLEEHHMLSWPDGRIPTFNTMAGLGSPVCV